MSVPVVMVFSMSFEPYQGRYRRVHNQATALVKEGYEVTLLAWDREAKSPVSEERDGIKIRRFRIKAGIARGPYRNALNVLRFNWRVFRYLMGNPFRVAHCYNLEAIMTVLTAARLRRKKCVLDLCEPEYYALWDEKYSPLLKIINFLEAGLAKRYDHVFVHNVYQVRKFTDIGVKNLSQVGSYPSLAPVGDRQSVQRKRPGDCVVLGRIGTIYEDNGIEELLEAFQILIDRRSGNSRSVDYRLMLAGRVFDSYRHRFNELVGPFDRYLDVRGPFEVSEMERLYGEIDISVIFVRKTKWFQNITPTKLFDSMAYGVPVLANDIGEVKQIVEEGPCGIIIDETRPASIADGIEALARDRKMLAEMGRAARSLARKKYNWDIYRPAFIEAYSKLATE